MNNTAAQSSVENSNMQHDGNSSDVKKSGSLRRSYPLINKNILIPIFIILVVIIALCISFKTNKWDTAPTPSTFANSPNLLYPEDPDPTGRNIYYNASGSLGTIAFSGVGVFYMPKGTVYSDASGNTIFTTSSDSQFIRYITGTFVGWTTIPGSNDRYITLQDNLHSIDRATGKSVDFPAIRVGFAKNDESVNDSTQYGTVLDIEDLSSVIPTVTDNKMQTIVNDKIGLIGSLTSSDLNKILKPGDTVAMIFTPNFTMGKDNIDSQGAYVASKIYIRRLHPKEDLAKELRKQIIQ